MRRNTAADTSGPNVGHDHQVVFSFAAPVTVSGASCPPASCTATGSGTTTITVNLHNVSNNQRLTITLTNVSGGGGGPGPVSIPMAILLADVNQSTGVNSGDVFLLQQQNGQALPTAGSADFRRDLNLNGSIDSGDVFLGQKQNPSQLPP
jgi:hypothetical protein